MKKDDVKTFGVILIVCIICIILVLIFNIKSNFEKLESVNEYNTFFVNVGYVNNYINNISNNNSEGVYSLLDKKYIEDNNINYGNVLDYTYNYSIGTSLKATSMDFVQVGNDFVYYIKGKLYQNVFEGIKLIEDNFSVIVINDFDNLSYSIYPVDDDNFEKVLNSIKKINISNNKYNGITKSDFINKEQICVMYLSDFVNNIDNSYNLLSAEMKKIYSTLDDYKKFISDNINRISSSADKCRLEEIDDKRVYTVIDDNENTYVFTEKAIMDYDVSFYLKEVTE